MTDIDPQADIELHSGAEHVTVRVPLAGTVTGESLRCYRHLRNFRKMRNLSSRSPGTDFGA